MASHDDKITSEELEVGYARSGNALGWRLLASPARVLDGAEVAFIGLHPGGRSEQADHPCFAPAHGSAYVAESWGGAPPGQGRLQKQARALFTALDVRAADVLAGNLVPFRSPSWAALEDPGAALAFGTSLWTRILRRARPSLVVTLGRPVETALAAALGAHLEARSALGWGKITGRRWSFAEGRIVALPHLSRFGVITRAASQPGLAALFGERWAV